MSIPVVIQGTTYNLPEQGTNPPWGTDLTAIIQALVDVANNTNGSSDILTTSFTLANNQLSSVNINGLSFDNSQVRSAVISYSIYRSTLSNEYSENGFVLITYSSLSGTWELARYANGNSGVDLTITNAGQFQYTSDNLIGSNYSSKMKFSAKAFLQA